MFKKSTKKENSLETKEQRKVMVVEDSDEDRILYQRYLRSDSECDYVFLEAETGAKAQEYLQQVDVDIILLDYLLPDINGLEWLAEWQQQNQKNYYCPVIVLTGEGDETIAVQAIKSGAEDYIVKSQLTRARLKQSVNRAMAVKQRQQKQQNSIDQLICSNQELTKSDRQYQQEILKGNNLHQIIDRVPVVIYAQKIDRKNKRSGKFWLVNQEFQRIFNWSEAEIIGKTIYDLFPTDRADALEANNRIVIETEKSLFREEKVVQADGQLHTYQSLKYPLFDENDRMSSIVGIAIDITQQTQAEMELEKSETKFRNTFEQAGIGMAHVLLEGKWLRVNRKLCEMIGYTKEELLQKTVRDIIHPHDLNTDSGLVTRMLAGEISNYSLQKRYVCQDRAIIWVNVTVSLVENKAGEPDYFIYTIEDINEQQSVLGECQFLEASLEKSVKRLSNLHQMDKAILEAQDPQIIAETAVNNIEQLLVSQRTSIVTFDWEKSTAILLAIHGQAKELTNVGKQVSLEVWQDLIAQFDNPNLDYAICYLHQFPKLIEAIPLITTAGIDCLICFPLRANGKLLGILKVWVENLWLVDIEELEIVSEVCNQMAVAFWQADLYKQAQKYAQKLEGKVAQRTAQLEEINQELKAFTYSVSHDLKAPLRAIQGFASALREDYGENLDDLGKEYTGRLISSAQQMEQLIQDLLTYSLLSRTEIQFHSVNLSSIVKQAISQLELDIHKSQVEIVVDEPLANMLGNQTVLLQVVTNLLSNAIKFVAPNVKPKLHIWTEVADNQLRLWIEDNGIGIEEQHQKRIFNVFERLHGNEAYSGTGIGLAIVKKAIERLGGTVGVESKLDRGSRFWIQGKCS